jgi:hypothetical protein
MTLSIQFSRNNSIRLSIWKDDEGDDNQRRRRSLLQQCITHRVGYFLFSSSYPLCAELEKEIEILKKPSRDGYYICSFELKVYKISKKGMSASVSLNQIYELIDFSVMRSKQGKK